MNERERDRAAVAVLGLGTVGASLALALKGSGRYATVVAWDPEFDAARRAQKYNVADRYAGSAPDAVRQAAVVFLGVATDASRDTLTAIGPHLRPGAIVCGLDEAQERVSGLAASILPGNVSFVAAHPALWELVGSEAAPSPSLFKRGVLCLSPLPSAHPDAVAYLAGLAETLELAPFFVDAREHDAFVAGVYRLPSVLAAAYLRAVARERSWRELGRIAGGGFRQLGVLADVEPAEAQQGLAASRDHLVRWLGVLIAELGDLRDALQDGREPDDFYAGAVEAWRKWQRDRQLSPQATDLPEPPPPPRRRFPF